MEKEARVMYLGGTSGNGIKGSVTENEMNDDERRCQIPVNENKRKKRNPNKKKKGGEKNDKRVYRDS